MIEIGNGKLYQGDCIKVMKELPDNSIDLTVTSPPYDDLRVYEGYSFEFEPIAKELLRVTKQGGVVVWVVKDAVKEGNRSLTSFRQALFFQQIGFKVYDVIIFSKNSSSSPHKNRYFDTFEYMFVFAKGLPKTVKLLRDRPNKCAGQSTWGNRSIRERDGNLTKKGKHIIPNSETTQGEIRLWSNLIGNPVMVKIIKLVNIPIC